MWYLIAKVRNGHGCYALKKEHGQHLIEMKRKLNEDVGLKGIQLVTISRPAAFGEYSPYHFINEEEEFISVAKALRP